MNHLPAEELIITVTYKGRKFTVPANEILIENLRLNGVPVSKGCLRGICGVCRVNLKQGEVEYRNIPLASLREGESLTCITTPKTDIEIDLS